MLKFTFAESDHIINENTLRNVEIRAFWGGLKYSDRPQYERLDITAKKFKISLDRVKQIVYRHAKDVNK